MKWVVIIFMLSNQTATPTAMFSGLTPALCPEVAQQLNEKFQEHEQPFIAVCDKVYVQ